MPNHSPVRPKPLMTSSQIMTMSYSSQMRRMVRQYSGAGTQQPLAVEMGSAMKAAMVSGRWNLMVSSMVRAQKTSHSG